jgi:hypothetical protein
MITSSLDVNYKTKEEVGVNYKTKGEEEEAFGA